MMESVRNEEANNNNVSSFIIASRGGNAKNVTPINLRSLFPNPSHVSPFSFKFIPLLEANGKVLVAAQTDFSQKVRENVKTW